VHGNQPSLVVAQRKLGSIAPLSIAWGPASDGFNLRRHDRNVQWSDKPHCFGDQICCRRAGR